MNLQRRQLLGIAASAPLAPPVLRAAEVPPAGWPKKPVWLIVPNVPGGGSDILARTLQGELQRLWNQSILIEYKPGGGTVLGTGFVAKAPADGYTLGLVVTSHVINPSLRKTLPFDTLKDFAHVSMTASSSMLLSASPQFAPRTLKELIDHCRAHPGTVTYATPGAGSSMHLAGELIKQKAGIDMLHVPYKGTGGAYADVAGGRVDLLIDPTFASMPHVKSGRLKPVAAFRRPSLDFATVEFSDNGRYDLKCPNGHDTTTVVQQQKYEILFEIGAHAILDGYYREAVSSFTASMERFFEYSMRVMFHHRTNSDSLFKACWRRMSKQSERQLGAYLAMWAAEWGVLPPLLEDQKVGKESAVAFRNAVIHNGTIPTRAEAIEFGEAILTVVRPAQATLQSLEQAVLAVMFLHIGRGQTDPRTRTGTYSINPILGWQGNLEPTRQPSLEDSLKKLQDQRALFASTPTRSTL